MAVEWTASALRDLTRITHHIERDNPTAARALVQSIRAKTGRLANFPLMGRPSERSEVRELVVHKNYLVSYRIGRDGVLVLQVVARGPGKGGS